MVVRVPLTDRAQCERGHSLLEPGAIEEYVLGKWRCVACRRHYDRERKRGYKRTRRKRCNTMVETRQQRDHTRVLLALYDAREHAPHWEKPEITRQIEALRA